jgi:hypothetical protein
MAKKAYERKYPTTGYWMFVCNPKNWNVDQWLELEEPQLFYRISKHHDKDFRSGQLGFLRVNTDYRNNAIRRGQSKLRAGIYAIFQVIGTAELMPDPDVRHLNNLAEASTAWRVPVRVLANLLGSPIPLSNLPNDIAFKRIHQALRTTTLAVSKSAFQKILKLAKHPELLKFGAVDEPTSGESRADAISRMARAAFSTAAYSNGQLLQRTIKNKDIMFSSRLELERHLNDLLRSQGGRCAITRIKFDFGDALQNTDLCCSLDRKDSNGHYERNNLQVVFRFINRWKSNGDNDKFKQLIKRLREPRR